MENMSKGRSTAHLVTLQVFSPDTFVPVPHIEILFLQRGAIYCENLICQCMIVYYMYYCVNWIFPGHWIQPLRSSLASEASFKPCHSCRNLNHKWPPIPNNPCLHLWWKIECNVNQKNLWCWVSSDTPRPLWFHDGRPAHQKHGKLEKNCPSWPSCQEPQNPNVVFLLA